VTGCEEGFCWVLSSLQQQLQVPITQRLNEGELPSARDKAVRRARSPLPLAIHKIGNAPDGRNVSAYGFDEQAVDTVECIWWYQQVSHVQISFLPARHWRLNSGISPDRTFASVVSAAPVYHQYAGTNESETWANTERRSKTPLWIRTPGNIEYSSSTRSYTAITNEDSGLGREIWFGLV
jgi:hypothetical protein